MPAYPATHEEVEQLRTLFFDLADNDVDDVPELSVQHTTDYGSDSDLVVTTWDENDEPTSWLLTVRKVES